tara:strand:- start:117 stop:278 length:162 start_codon:yes stop_codon:yes gene_type:complete
MKNTGIQTIKINKILSRIPFIGAYARGGMVTKFKVEKGQSKWIKKFVEQMRNK